MANTTEKMITLSAKDLYQLELKIFEENFRIFADCVTIIQQLSMYAGKHNKQIPADGIPLPSYVDSLAVIRVYSEVLGRTPSNIKIQDGKKIAEFENE